MPHISQSPCTSSTALYLYFHPAMICLLDILEGNLTIIQPCYIFPFPPFRLLLCSRARFNLLTQQLKPFHLMYYFNLIFMPSPFLGFCPSVFFFFYIFRRPSHPTIIPYKAVWNFYWETSLSFPLLHLFPWCSHSLSATISLNPWEDEWNLLNLSIILFFLFFSFPVSVCHVDSFPLLSFDFCLLPILLNLLFIFFSYLIHFRELPSVSSSPLLPSHPVTLSVLLHEGNSVLFSYFISYLHIYSLMRTEWSLFSTSYHKS